MTGSALVGALRCRRASHAPALAADYALQPLRVRNEFGALRTALVHDASNAIDTSMEDLRRWIPPDELAEHPESGPSFRRDIIAQHAAFRRVLEEHGVALISPQTQAGAFCQVFARDPCFVVGDILFVARLRDDYRHPETDGLAPLRRRVRTVVSFCDRGSLIEGGDVMVLDGGSRVLVGTHRHTNALGFGTLRAYLARRGVEAIRVPHRALHLDCCLAPLPSGEALYSARKLPDSSLTLLRRHFERLIPLDQREAKLNLAANLFWINERTVVSNTAAARTNQLLRDKRYHVIGLDFSQLVCLWGSFRCVVCPLERA